MTFAELNSLLIYYRELIANTWNFYLSVHLAIIGIIFLAKENRINLYGILFLSIPYFAFMYINLMAQVDNYAMTASLRDFAFKEFAANPEFISVLSTNKDAAWINDYMFFIYGMTSIFTLSLVAFVEKFKK